MPQLHNAKRLAEASLRKIGEYSINDSGAGKEAMDETLFWMDMCVASLNVHDCYWLMPATIAVTLTADTQSYDLKTVMGSDYPSTGLFFVVSATIDDGNGNENPVEIIRRQDYEDIAKKDTSGRTDQIYVDRLTEETLYVHPVMGTGQNYVLNLVIFKYAVDFTTNGGKVNHEFPPEWQPWLIIKTAAEIGDGPVRRLPVSETDRLEKKADKLLKELMSHSNREKRLTGRTARWD